MDVFVLRRYTVVKYFGVRMGDSSTGGWAQANIPSAKNHINLLKGGSVSEVKEGLLALIP